MAATNGHTNGTAPKIILYTNHRCPFAHRAHIALKELDLPFEEVIIDLDNPRPQWYLDINPRGLVPSIKYTVPGVYDEEIVTESAIVAEFLANSFPAKNGSNILPDLRHGGPKAPLERARITFFTDTFNSKVSSFWFQTLMAEPGSPEKQSKAEEWFKAVEKEIEPLLSNAAPYFNGSKTLTFAEVFAAPFIVRWYALGKHDDLIPTSFIQKLDGLPKFRAWAKAIMENENVTKVVDWEEGGPDAMRKKVEEFRAKTAAAAAAKK